VKQTTRLQQGIRFWISDYFHFRIPDFFFFFLFLQSMLILLLNHIVFFFLHVQSEIVVHEFEKKGMSFLFEIPNFLQSHVYKDLFLSFS
jgi:hypothetical protein